jgi:hypothetical protein
MNAFPVFIPPPNTYPEPTPFYTGGAPIPTNSWAENALKGTVPSGNGLIQFPDGARDIKPMPWFVRGEYTTSNLHFGHSEIGPITHAFQAGNNTVSIDAGDFINNLSIGPNLRLISVEDCSVTFRTDTAELYAVQGSPTMNIGILPSNELTLPFIFASTNIFDPTLPLTDTVVELPFVRTETTFGVFNLVSVPVRWFQRYDDTGLSALLSDFTFAGLQPLTGTVTTDGNVVASFTNGVFTSATGATWNPITRTITLGGGRALRFVEPATINEPKLVYSEYTFSRDLTFRIATSGDPMTVIRNEPNQLRLTVPASDLPRYLTLDVYDTDPPPLGAVTTRLVQSVDPSSPGSYSLNWTTVTPGNIYTYFPRRYLTYYDPLPHPEPLKLIRDVTYNICELLQVDPTTVFTVSDYSPPPPLPDLAATPIVDSVVRQTLTDGLQEKATYDLTTTYRFFNLPLDRLRTSYLYSQHAATYARVLWFQNITGGLNNPEYITHFRDIMTTWMTSINGSAGGPADANQIKTETVWKGLITLTDYYDNLGVPGAQANFGFSFYNDHHLHWGYLIYASYILSVLDPVWGTTYRLELQAILTDYIAPDSSVFTKSRCKNWYFGHSWATGVVNATDIDQESVSEAINSYYAAYLLASYLKLDDYRVIAEAALFSEIAAYNAYWVNTEDVLETPSASVIKQGTRTYAALAAGAPTSYPSNSVYRYSIISLPLTEISPRFINREWVMDLFTNLQDWLRVDSAVLFGLTNYSHLSPTWKYVPRPAPQDNLNDPNKTTAEPWDVTEWGIFFLQAVALFGDIFPKDPSKIDNLNTQYNKVVDRVHTSVNTRPALDPVEEQAIGLFDSLTNAYWFLFWIGGYYPLGVTETESASGVVPLPTPSVTSNIKRNRSTHTRVESTIGDKIPLTHITPKIVGKIPSTRVSSRTSAAEIPSTRVPSTHISSNCDCVTVPTITMVVTPTANGLDVASAVYTITDVVTYYEDCPYDTKLNCLKRIACPDELEVTELSYDGDSVDIRPVVNSDDVTLRAQCDDLNVPTEYFVQYSYLRLILSKILFGTYDREYLRRSYNDEFFRRLARSRFNLFLEYFTSLRLVDENNLLYIVIGYGNVPQLGNYYFRL